MARKSAPKGRAPKPITSPDRTNTPQPQREDDTVVFFHPDLGIGGAERLVVDAAVGLQNRGHKVVIFTNHCDPGHCFDECRDGTSPPSRDAMAVGEKGRRLIRYNQEPSMSVFVPPVRYR